MKLTYTIDEISEEEQDKWVKSSPYGDVIQLSGWGKFNENVNASHVIAFYDDGKLIGTEQMMFYKSNIPGHTYAALEKGPVFDYDREEYYDFIFKTIKKIAKKYKALTLRVDPFVKRSEKDEAFVEKMKGYGFVHKGFLRELKSTCHPRINMDMNIDVGEEEIFSRFTKDVQRKIKKSLKNKVSISLCGPEAIDDFWILMEETCRRDGFSLFTRKEAMLKFLNSFRKDEDYILPICYIKVSDLSDSFKSNREESVKLREKIQKKLDRVRDTEKDDKILNMEKEINILTSKIEDFDVEIDKLNEKYGGDANYKIPLCGGVFFHMGSRFLYMYGGSSDSYRELYGTYLMQWEMIREAERRGAKIYDFGGVSGYYDEEGAPDGEPVGLYRYKKQFGSDITEYIGDFECVINKPLYGIFNIVKKLLGRA